MNDILPAGAPMVGGAAKAAMPSYRVENFQRAVGERLRKELAQGKPRGESVARMIRENEALAMALNDATLAVQSAQAFQRLMAEQSPNAVDAVKDADARRELSGILKRRGADARAFADMLRDPKFVAACETMPENPPGPYQLPEAKKEEMIRRLVQVEDVAGAEPTIHVAASAMGQRQLHAALAKLFAADGAMHAPLMEALKKAMPEATDAEVHVMTLDWLKARQGPAQATADGMAQDGVIYNEAMRRAQLPHAPVAAIAKPLLASTVLTPHLTPREREQQKSSQQHAEDMIYTLNHTLTCLTLTDFVVAPFFSNLFGWKICGHDHSGIGHDHDHDHHGHEHHDHAPAAHNHAEENQSLWKRFTRWSKSQYPNFREWMIGEVAGDLGAVPVTLAVQHFTPGVMSGIQHTLDPVIGGLLRSRTKKAAEKWADAHGLAHDSIECVNHAQELFHYEDRHAPQMAVWTVASSAINYAVMKTRNPRLGLAEFASGKVAGAAITAGLVFGTRSFVPEAAHKWDQAVGRNVIVPVTKRIGGLFGMREADIDASHAKQSGETPASWVARAQQNEPQPLMAARL